MSRVCDFRFSTLASIRPRENWFRVKAPMIRMIRPSKLDKKIIRVSAEKKINRRAPRRRSFRPPNNFQSLTAIHITLFYHLGRQIFHLNRQKGAGNILIFPSPSNAFRSKIWRLRLLCTCNLHHKAFQFRQILCRIYEISYAGALCGNQWCGHPHKSGHHRRRP